MALAKSMPVVKIPPKHYAKLKRITTHGEQFVGAKMDLHINGIMVFNALVSIAVFFIGLWFKRLDGEFKQLHDEVDQVKRDYLSKEVAGIVNKNVMEKLDAITKQLNSITEKLDKKADK